MNFQEAPEDDVLQNEIDAIVKDFDFPELKEKSVLITGAAGLIGSQIVRVLAAYNRVKKYNTRIIAFVHNLSKAQEVFAPLINRRLVTIIGGDVLNPLIVDKKIDFVIHAASPTASAFFVDHPVETIRTAVDGTRNVLELAREKKIKSMVYLSSLEVYGIPDGHCETIREEDYGYIDSLSVRSSYSEGKKMTECLCASYAKEYNVPVKVARLSQTFGPGVDIHDRRVFAEFIRCAIEQKDIILHTAGRTIRTYCSIKDAVTAILTILEKGRVGKAYNVANMETAISIREMADLVAHLYGDKIHVRTEIPENLEQFGYNPEMVIRLNTDKLNSLGWNATVSLEEMLRATGRSMELRMKGK